MSLELPPSYEPLRELGKGGGGEVWEVRDRHTGAHYALKVLAENASESEMTALVREAVTLSGLEGLGVPRVLRFGRLPRTGRPYLVRELVEGRSLQELIDDRANASDCLEALVGAAEQATLLHRTGLLHGDIKPANIIVDVTGRATLVDLGLAAPWREGGTAAPGLTPKYAAPELLLGKPLTVRAEVYALGVALRDVLQSCRGEMNETTRPDLEIVAERATRPDPAERFPSADEFAGAVRRAARLGDTGRRAIGAAELWPIVGIEATASRLGQAASALMPGHVLSVQGAPGSGRSVLLRRLGWTLGVAGAPLVFIDEAIGKNVGAIRAELAEDLGRGNMTILVDDVGRLPPECVAELERALSKGARMVAVGEGSLTRGATPFEVPPLGDHSAAELVRRAVPSLTDALIKRVVAACHGRAGELRRLVRLIAERAIASEQDLEDLGAEIDQGPTSLLPTDPLARALSFLDRGRYNDARDALEITRSSDDLILAIAWARLHLGLGDARGAHERLLQVEAAAKKRTDSPEGVAWGVYAGRAQVGLGEYAAALSLLESPTSDPGPLGAEALAYRGLALSYTGNEVEARAELTRAIERATTLGAPRVEALGHACLGSVLQRADDTEGARAAYENAIAAAQRASDAGVLATAQLNLAGLLKVSGDVAGAIEHFEAAVDMGKRSGRRATVRQALLNLVNLDLYLGRLARAESSLETLVLQRPQLSLVARAQLLGLEAELFVQKGNAIQAEKAYSACADAYEELSLRVDAAEARLEGILAATRSGMVDPKTLHSALAQAEEELGASSAHRALLGLARASVAWAEGDERSAKGNLEAALAAAREAAQKDFIWRTLEARSVIEELAGQPMMARRDREEALAVLEEIAARLPRDLREVFWNDPRRRSLRGRVTSSVASASTELAEGLVAPRIDSGLSGTSSIASMTSTPLERRLARILEINTELLGEVNLSRLATRVTDHAVDMLQAERGFVLLRDNDGALTVHTSRARLGDATHAEFSRSIAEQVVTSGQPVVALNAKGDARLRSFASVHQLALESVACVPIQSRQGNAIGALYLETRLRSGIRFEQELPTLRAFADQVAIAIETAGLIQENVDKASELAAINRELEKARAELQVALGDRTEALRRTRKKLRSARDTLYGHFGYQGLVGTSASMRRVYALIDRVKDADVPVLITGESGTGKEVAARAIHRASPRASRPFFGLNCGAVPEHLLESELFGHVRGAFTGADRERKGLFREASGGTLLLDEIGEMPPRMQTGLLRVLQEHKVRPVGAAHEEEVDVRLIFATHRNLSALVKEGRFREDLYYRIHVVELAIPPLREHVEDIPPLVDHFLGIFAARYKREKPSITREASKRLAAFDWPGNVRQLEHVLLNAWILSEHPVLEADDFDIPDGYQPPADAEPFHESTKTHERSSYRPSSRATPSAHRRDERERILRALESCNGNRVAAAKLAGIPRRTFYRRLREYGIQ